MTNIGVAERQMGLSGKNRRHSRMQRLPMSCALKWVPPGADSRKYEASATCGRS
jgi:hypothetical protein